MLKRFVIKNKKPLLTILLTTIIILYGFIFSAVSLTVYVIKNFGFNGDFIYFCTSSFVFIISFFVISALYRKLENINETDER